MRDRFGAGVQWIDVQRCDERTWIAGARPSLCDVNAYMNIWYVRAHLENADELLAEYDHARAWAARLREVGHGTRTEMSSAEALDIAARATPQTDQLSDPADPTAREPAARSQAVPTA